MVITPEIEDKLPTWAEVVSLHRPKPIIHGLDRLARNSNAQYRPPMLTLILLDSLFRVQTFCQS